MALEALLGGDLSDLRAEVRGVTYVLRRDQGDIVFIDPRDQALLVVLLQAWSWVSRLRRPNDVLPPPTLDGLVLRLRDLRVSPVMRPRAAQTWEETSPRLSPGTVFRFRLGSFAVVAAIYEDAHLVERWRRSRNRLESP